MREERPIIAMIFQLFEDVKNFLEHFPEDEKLFVKNQMEFSMQSAQKLFTI